MTAIFNVANNAVVATTRGNDVRKWATAIVTAALVLAGCSPDRAEESARIAEEIKALPGVENTTYYQHSNPLVVFKEPSFYLMVRPRRDVTGAQLAQVWNSFARKVFDTGYRGFRVVLDVGDCPEEPYVHGPINQSCNGLSSDVDRRNPAPPTPSYGAWLAMIQGHYAFAVHGTSTNRDNTLRQRFMFTLYPQTSAAAGDDLPSQFRPTDITSTYRRILKDFPELREASWDVTATDTYRAPHLEISGGAPTEQILRLWDELSIIQVPSAAEFVMNSAGQQPDSVNTVRTVFPRSDPELQKAETDGKQRTLAQLEILKKFGQPIKYEATVTGQGPVTVFVNGCSDSPGSGWTADLRNKYETCHR